jgi:hypothetical protein
MKRHNLLLGHHGAAKQQCVTVDIIYQGKLLCLCLAVENGFPLSVVARLQLPLLEYSHNHNVRDTNLMGRFPSRFDNTFHSFCDAEPRKICQLCACKEIEHDPAMGKRTGENVMTNTGRQRMVVKRTPRNTNNIICCIICNVELCVPCFGESHGHIR